MLGGAMKPGRELDSLVAEKVMGWRKDSDGDWERPSKDAIDGWYPDHLFPYSTDIAAAWEVVEKLTAQFGDDFTIWSIWSRENKIRARFNRGESRTYAAQADAPTAPHAICLAALKAVGHEIS